MKTFFSYRSKKFSNNALLLEIKKVITSLDYNEEIIKEDDLSFECKFTYHISRFSGKLIVNVLNDNLNLTTKNIFLTDQGNGEKLIEEIIKQFQLFDEK